MMKQDMLSHAKLSEGPQVQGYRAAFRKVTVDRSDFLVIGYNRYGERIDYYGSNTFSFYTDEELKPGKTTPQDYYYTQSALNEATKIRIAIEKYHTTDGKTVTVPEYQLKWSTYTK